MSRYVVMARDVMGAKDADIQRLGERSGLDLTWNVKAQDPEEAIALARHQLEKIEGHSRHYEIVTVEGLPALPYGSRCVLQLVERSA